MTPAPENHRGSADPPATGDEGTGLAGLRTWRAVYIFVAIVFVVWVTILYALTRTFS